MTQEIESNEKPEKPKTSRQIRAEQTKRELLEVGGHLIRKMRLDEVSIHDIVGEAGVSTGTFYLYFSSKEAFFSEVFFHYNAALSDVPELNKDEPAIDQLVRFVNRFLDILGDMDVHFVQQWFAHFGDSSFYEPYGYSSNPGERHYAHIRDCLRKAVDDDELVQETPVYDLTNVISMLLSGISAHVAMSSRGFNFERRAKFLRRYILEDIVGPYRTQKHDKKPALTA